MDYGMPFLIETETIDKCVNICTSLGLKFIELNMNFPQCQMQNLDSTKLNTIRKEKGIYFTIHLDEAFNICDFNLRVKDAYRRTMLDAIKLAKEIKAPVINMHLAKGIYITLPERRIYLFKEFENIYYKNIAEFRDMCEEAIGLGKVKIAIENTDGFQEYEQRAVERLLTSQVFGLTFDIGHSHVVKDIDVPFYKKHENRLIHMHAHDGKGTSNHLAFGDGEIDLKQRLQMAGKAGARVVLETKTIHALTKTVEVLPQYM